MTVDDVEILRALDGVTDPRESPVATPGEVADELPIGAEAVRQRLMRLAADDDGIRTRKAGRARLFWTWKDWEHNELPEDAGTVRFETVDEDGEVSPVDVDEVLQEESADVPGDDDRRDWLAELEAAPQSTREEFEEAARAVAELAEERGAVTRKQTQKALHDEYPAGYGDNERTWWRRVARPVLAGHPEVESPPDGGSKWRYVG